MNIKNIKKLFIRLSNIQEVEKTRTALSKKILKKLRVNNQLSKLQNTRLLS